MERPLRLAAIIGAVIGAPVLVAVVAVELGTRACVAAIDAPEGRWVREAEVEGPTRAPPGHALVLKVDATRTPETSAQDEHGSPLVVDCTALDGGSSWTCALPAGAVSFRISTSGPCGDAPVRKASSGLYRCDPPPAEKLSVRTAICPTEAPCTR